MDMPEDIRKRAEALTSSWLAFPAEFGKELSDIIAEALLSERLAQKERDAKIAEAALATMMDDPAYEIGAAIRQS